MRRDGRGGILGINHMEMQNLVMSSISPVMRKLTSISSEHVKLNWEHLGASAATVCGVVRYLGLSQDRLSKNDLVLS